MTDGSIESELKEMHKKLNDLEKKQEMLNKIQQLERTQQEKMAKKPHSYEMMWYNIDI